ncbi:MAG: redoxin protein [Mucilaginibacter sp.]|nr:redoxin protein [Mucilaginibacter sp.]
MKTTLKYSVYVISFLIIWLNQPAWAQTVTPAKARKTIQATPEEIKKLQTKVEANPDSLNFHQAYIKAAGIESPEVAAQYDVWMAKFPKSAIVPYAIGKSYASAESPKAKPYLLKAVKIDPKFTEAWGGLWEDAQRWGDFKGGDEYLKKATESDPSNAAYAFYYTMSFEKADPALYRQKILDLAKRFPENERGAQGLYWLAERSNDTPFRIKIYEQLKNSFLPGKFNWSNSGMSAYFTLLLDVDPEKAVALAQEMVKLRANDKSWPGQVTVAQNVVEATKLISEKKGAEALTLIASMKLPRYFPFKTGLSILKAQAVAVSVNTTAAYDSLMVYFVKTPDVKLKKCIADYGGAMGKNSIQVEADIWKKLDAVSKQATPFTLKRYLTPGMASLSDYQGKVVLLTYWFPGCGPCRGEFPHFEKVIREFKGKPVDYLGLNIAPEQNEYVIPFMKSSGYSFTPLEDVKGRVKGNIDNGSAAPVNFLIDQQGRIIFSDFSINETNEDQLEMMINLILAHGNKA